MYAVILSGGKQYRITEGQTLKVESLVSDIGADVTFDNVLMIGGNENMQFGAPYLKNTKVLATVVAHGRHKKVHIVKFKRRKHHEKWQGHRQNFTEVKINKIEV